MAPALEQAAVEVMSHLERTVFTCPLMDRLLCEVASHLAERDMKRRDVTG